MADIKIKHTDRAGTETTVEVTGLEYGASDFVKDVLDKLGGAREEPMTSTILFGPQSKKDSFKGFWPNLGI